MNKTQEALKMTIEALEDLDKGNPICTSDLLQACKEALEEAEKQEPVAYKVMAIDFDIEDGYTAFISLSNPIEIGTKLYTHPATWQSLSDEEIATIWMNEPIPMTGPKFKQVYIAIETKLKELNHD